MAKKRINITVNEEAYKIAKNNINNISALFEEFLKLYVNSTNTTVENIQFEIDIEEEKIGKSLTKITFLQKEMEKRLEEDAKTIKNKDRVWTNFKMEMEKRKKDKKYEYMDPDTVKEAEQVLKYPKRVLIEIYNFVKYNHQNFLCPISCVGKWRYIEPEWRKYNDKLL